MARPLSKQSLIRITATGLKEHTCDWPTQWLVTARLPHTGGGLRHANDRPPRVLLHTAAHVNPKIISTPRSGATAPDRGVPKS